MPKAGAYAPFFLLCFTGRISDVRYNGFYCIAGKKAPVMPVFWPKAGGQDSCISSVSAGWAI